MDPRITYSQIDTAKKCQRMHHLAYGLGWRKLEDAKALRIGNTAHNVLDLTAKGMESNEAIETALVEHAQSRSKDMTDEQKYEWALEREVISRLMAGYYWRWAETDKNIEILESEQTFEMPIVNPDTGHPMQLLRFTGKTDKKIRADGHRIKLREHKTVSCDISPDSEYWKYLRIDAQASFYVLGNRSQGEMVDTVEYDVLRKPATKPAMLIQAQSLRLLETGEYIVKNDADEWEVIGTFNVKFNTENGTIQQLTVNGAFVEVKVGKTVWKKWKTPAIAIRESIEMYGDRLSFDIGLHPDKYYARRDICRTEASLKDAQYDMYQWALQLRSNDRFNRHPHGGKIACIGYGRCRYFDLCTDGYDLTSGIVPEGFEKVEDVHQELIEQ